MPQPKTSPVHTPPGTLPFSEWKEEHQKVGSVECPIKKCGSPPFNPCGLVGTDGTPRFHTKRWDLAGVTAPSARASKKAVA